MNASPLMNVRLQAFSKNTPTPPLLGIPEGTRNSSEIPTLTNKHLLRQRLLRSRTNNCRSIKYVISRNM